MADLFEKSLTRETEEVVQVSMSSFMPCFRNITELRREKIASQFVYFSSVNGE